MGIDISRLNPELIKEMSFAGFVEDESQRSGYYVLQDNEFLGSSSKDENLVIMNINEAKEKFSFVKDYMWSLINKDKDEYTQRAAQGIDGGYFIWVKKGAKIELPLQTCLMVCKNKYEQVVHNFILVEEDAQLRIITGCLEHSEIDSAKHIGLSEIILKKNSKLNFTMVHNWKKDTFVRPRTAISVAENAEFVSNYVILNPVKDLQTFPVATVQKNGRAVFNSIINGKNDSLIDTGARINLVGEGCSGEIVSRAVVSDTSKVYSRGQLIGDNKCKTHMECNGIVLGDSCSMIAVPELEANNSQAEMSHEAAVGKIADKEIFYLMTRGLSEEEAVSTIIRGFMDVSIFGLPKHLEKNIQQIIDDSAEGF